MAEETVESSATDAGESAAPEAPVGNQHFRLSDGPPGSGAPELDAASQATSSDGQSKQGETGATPASPFFEFKTATGESKSFSTRDEANQFFSSWNGRLSKTERDLKEAERLNFQWQDAYENGRLYEHYAQQREGSKGNKAEPAKPESSSEDQAAMELLSKVDKKYVTELLKKGESVKALEYITYLNGLHFEQKLAAYKQELAGALDEIVAPSRFQEQVVNSVSYIAESEYQSTDDSGQPRYPEFVDGPRYDKGLVHHFRNVWLDMPVEEACTPQGFRLAYLEAKSTYQPRQSATGPASTPESNARAADMVRDATGRFVAKQTALAMSSEGTKFKPPVGGPGPTAGQSVLDGMRSAAKNVNPHFRVSSD